MEYSRIKKIAKAKNVSMAEIAKAMGITYVALNRRLQVARFSTLEEIAAVLDCEVVEMIDVGPGFFHAYDDAGTWLGVMKKTV